MDIKPIKDRILVRLIPFQGERIVIAHGDPDCPELGPDEKFINDDVTAEVLAVGPQCSDDIKVGDTVKVEPFSGYIMPDARLWLREEMLILNEGGNGNGKRFSA